MREERRGGKRENFKKVIVHISSRSSVSYHSPVSWLKGFKGKTKTIATDNTAPDTSFHYTYTYTYAHSIHMLFGTAAVTLSMSVGGWSMPRWRPEANERHSSADHSQFYHRCTRNMIRHIFPQYRRSPLA